MAFRGRRAKNEPETTDKPETAASAEQDKSPSSLERLQAGRREKLIELLRQGGAEDAESIADSEISEGIPQTARFAFIRAVWRNLERWRSDGYVSAWADEHNLSDEDRESLRKLVASAVYDATWDMIMVIDDGELDDGLDWPMWELAELDSNFHRTGRSISGLHESFMSWDPSGQEAREFRDTK